MTETPAPELPQRVISQCVLLSSMTRLSLLYNNYLNRKTLTSTEDIYPKNGKIIRLRTENPAIVTTKLSGCSYSNLAKKLTPKHLSLLVPRLNITKVIYTEPDNSDTIDVPISFSQNEAVGSDFDKNVPMLDSAIHRGFGVGVQSFNWEYAGTSPATARKDVKASLTITANSFSELMKERQYVHPDTEVGTITYRIIDLVTHPSHIVDDDDQPQAAGTPTIYDPRDYKIRVEAGWNTPDASIKPLFYDLFGPGDTINRDEELDAFFSCMTEVLLLTLNDHDININENGQVTMTIEYRAYAEESIQGPMYNVLYPTKELFDKYNELKQKFVEINNACNQISSEDDPPPDDIQAQRESASQIYAAQIGNTKYLGMQAIIKKLHENGRVFHVTVNKEELSKYVESGLDLGALIYAEGSSALDTSAGAVAANVTAAAGISDEELEQLSKGELEDFTINGETEPNPDVVPITYFFMGDLLDIVYANYVYTGGPDKLKLILPDFPHTSNDTIKYTNIAHIPITLEYFVEWWATQVIAKDVETYSLMDFLRNMTQTMISDLLGRDCIKNRVDFVSNFQIAFLKSANTFEDLDSEGGFLFDLNTIPTGYLSINETVDSKDVTNYLILYPSNTLYLDSETDTEEKLAGDQERGVVYLSIGSKTGFVKTINFAKANIPGLREARYEAYGITNPLAQLSNVYNADVSLYGIPNFYPGNRVFIDPFSLGIGFPWIPEQPAFNLGIGGYHIVVRVSSQMARGEYTTTLSCRWESSDGKKRLFDGPVDPQAGSSKPAAGSWSVCTSLLTSFNSTYGSDDDS
jgi:hypothetical protein